MKNVNHLPYDTIVQACKGEPIAVSTVLSHYDRYIKYVSIVGGKVHPDTEDYVMLYNKNCHPILKDFDI